MNKINKKIIKSIGVLRDTARAPQPPTNPPTGHQMSRQGLAKVRSQKEKTILFGKFSQHGGGGLPKSQNFCKFTKYFFYAKFILRC